MSLITIKDLSELKKYLKDGTDNVYEFKILGIFVDVKFKCDIFDTRNKRKHELKQDGGVVILKARSIKAKNLIVDRIEVDKIKADSIVATYIFAKKVKANTIESMNIEAEKVKCKILNSLVLQANKIKSEYVDICELRNCNKLKAKKVSMLSMDGGRVITKCLSFNDKNKEDCLPITKRRFEKQGEEKK